MIFRGLVTKARLLLAAVSFSAAFAGNAVAKDAPPIEFNRDIRPILSETCLQCHGPAEDTRQAELRLDMRDDALADRGGYFVISPRKPAESELLRRITSNDPNERMPPADSGHDPLTPAQIDLIRRWIEQGAPWQQHWAFIAPTRAALPHNAGAQKWARNAIDHFVYAKMQDAKLTPNPEADRYVLARRLALDLTGLPATPGQVQAFVDDKSSDAYEKYVRSLLDSPAYGEHQARYWLDAARYGDTHGMHFDNYREMWPYRDWVIAAFNRNLPYDEFIIEQLAGDLLPDPTLDQRIATGFNRCNITSSEAGAIKDELATQYVIDRINTFGTVFLGMTVGCAQCHDHKFDPVSQKEFYQLYAFFNNSVGPAMDGNRKDTPPVVVVPDAAHREPLAKCDRLGRELSAAMSRRVTEVLPNYIAWRRAGDASKAAAAAVAPVSNDGLVFWLPLDDGNGTTVRAQVDGEWQNVDLPDSATWTSSAPLGCGIEFTKDKPLVIENAANLDADQPFTLSFWLRSPDAVSDGQVFEKLDAAVNGSGWTVIFDSRYDLTMKLVAAAGKDELRALAADGPLTSGKWSHVCIRYPGSRAVSSFTVHVDGRLAELRINDYEHVTGSIRSSQPLLIGSRLTGGALSDVRVFDRYLSDEEAQLLAETPALHDELQRPENQPPSENVLKNCLALRYYCNTQDARYRELSDQYVANFIDRDRIRVASPTSLIMEERTDQTPFAHILYRGDYAQKRDKVGAAVPAVFPPLSDDARVNRLGLARWLTAPSHPLTARVAVNRAWQNLFGIGIVRTAEDFGTRGEPPTHQQLLDWLSVEFVESGWDVKRLCELIVTSSTYRQSSVRTAEKLAVDPENRLLSCGPRYRLDAEILRDQALFASGLLVPNVGGPSVKPYQPPGVWEAVAFQGSNTEKFRQDHGAALYRRSLYTFWKRTAAPPSLAVFNAPTRESCTVRRERTNTPLQALALMNDPQYVEAARVLAEHVLRDQINDDERLSRMLRRVTGKPLRRDEEVLLKAALARFKAHFAAKPAAADKLIRIGERPPDASLDATDLAAWTMVANVLLNRDDVVNKE